MSLQPSVLRATIAILLLLFFVSGRAMATVGGPIYISDIAYNPINELVYYQKNDLGGQGCPPIIHILDTTNNTDTEVKSCIEVFKEFRLYIDEKGQENYTQYKSNLYKGLPYLASVDLQKNKIDINVVSLNEHIEGEEKYWTEFLATVTQEDKEVSTINFRGCNKEQPHVFEGYMIPNTNNLVLLISSVGDCFEGGYIYESLHVVNNIKYYDTKSVRNYKTAAATEPNSGNLVLKASLNSDISLEPSLEPAAKDTSDAVLPILALSSFITLNVGIVLGFILGKITNKRTKKQLPDSTINN